MGDYFFDRLFHSPGIYSLIAHLAHRLSLDVDHCLGTLKLKGIKLHPEIEFFDPNESELMEPIYEAARRYHVSIIFHTGMSSKALPGVIAELAARYKDVPVILGHMGVSEYVKLAVAVARQNQNIFLETSVVGWMPLLLETFRGAGTSKILFGSDHPYNPLGMEVDKIAKHVTRAAKLKEDDLKKVFAENFLSILKHDRWSARTRRLNDNFPIVEVPDLPGSAPYAGRSTAPVARRRASSVENELRRHQ